MARIESKINRKLSKKRGKGSGKCNSWGPVVSSSIVLVKIKKRKILHCTVEVSSLLSLQGGSIQRWAWNWGWQLSIFFFFFRAKHMPVRSLDHHGGQSGHQRAKIWGQSKEKGWIESPRFAIKDPEKLVNTSKTFAADVLFTCLMIMF